MKTSHTPPSSSYQARSIVILAATLVLYQMALAFMRPPFGWIFLVFAAAALAFCICIRKPWVTSASLTAFAFFIICAGAEFFLEPSARPVVEGLSSQHWDRKDPDLGYAPRPGVVHTASRLTYQGTTFYDVAYTTNAAGWRATPEREHATAAVFFFGCSFTFGEGVQDAEAYPYQVAALLGPDYQVFNFGLQGYGPHHFLALLESGRLDALLRAYAPVRVFFLNIAGHELRAAGHSRWDMHGPRYVLQNGTTVRQGNFTPLEKDITTNPALAFLYAEAQKTKRKSNIYQRIFLDPKEEQREAMQTLQSAIFTRAARVLVEHYNVPDFELIVYPDAESNIAGFQAAGLRVLMARSFFPDDPMQAKYKIPNDTHPSALAHKLLAQGLAQHICATEAARHSPPGPMQQPE